MMRCLLFCVLSSVWGNLYAQNPPPRRDTIRFAEWRQEITRAPVLTGGSQPIIIVPNRQPYCFDKQLYLKMKVGRLDAEQSVYLDTHNGLTGILPPSSHGGAVVEIMPELENFTFTVMSMKGNVYMYKNQKSKRGIDHWVRTGNTQNFLYQSPTATRPAGADMLRKAEMRAYCDNKINARAYRYDGSPNTFFIYGDRYPEKLHPLKFLGAFGVGYMYCEEGLYLIMETNFGANYVRIGTMENVHNCFNPAAFQVQEDAFHAKQQQEIEQEEANVARRQEQVTGECTAEKQAIVDFKRLMNKKHEDLLRLSQHGNVYQDTAAQRAILNMSDPLDNVRENILNVKLSICVSHRHGGTNVSCFREQLSALQDAETRMMALDQQYASQPARAGAEKKKLYWELMKTMVRCD
jgi:hypothetical protein